MKNMISREEAMRILFSRWSPLELVEMVPVSKAIGRVLTQAYFSKHNIPVVRAAGMDGVAVDSSRFADGIPDTSDWQRGRDYVRADTGDDFDDKFDAVIRIEDVEILPDGGLKLHNKEPVRPGQSVGGSGSSLKQGAKISNAGLPLRATDLAALGMGGITEVEVYKRPRVTFIPTGSELIPIGAPLERGRNYDTNSIMALHMLEEMGAEPVCVPIVRDDPERLRAALQNTLQDSDLVILNGGSSKGDEDFNTRLLRSEGELLLHGVSAGPGRPIGIAMIGDKPILNLAGPAIGTFYSMEWCVRPIICKFLHLPVPKKTRVRGKLTEDMRCAPPMDFLCRVEVSRGADGYFITPMSRGKADLPSMLCSNAMFISPVGESFYPAGSEIEVELLRDASLIPNRED